MSRVCEGLQLRHPLVFLHCTWLLLPLRTAPASPTVQQVSTQFYLSVVQSLLRHLSNLPCLQELVQDSHRHPVCHVGGFQCGTDGAGVWGQQSYYYYILLILLPTYHSYNFLFSLFYFQLPTPYFILFISDFLHPSSYFLLPNSYLLLFQFLIWSSPGQASADRRPHTSRGDGTPGPQPSDQVMT